MPMKFLKWFAIILAVIFAAIAGLVVAGPPGALVSAVVVAGLCILWSRRAVKRGSK